MGQRDDAMVASVGKTVEFLETIGNERIEERVRQLATALKEGIQAAVPSAEFHTPFDSAMSGGVIVVGLPGVDASEAFATLYQEHNIGCAARRGDFAGIRLCPHIYNTLAEVETVVRAIKALA